YHPGDQLGHIHWKAFAGEKGLLVKQFGGDRVNRYWLDFDAQACLRPRDRFWDIPVPKIDSAFDNLLVPQPSWSPSTTQQLRKLVAAPYLPPNDWTPRSEAYFVFPLAQGTPGKQCGLAATGVYQPSLRSPWLAAIEGGDTEYRLRVLAGAVQALSLDASHYGLRLPDQEIPMGS
ncbi:DUF58 domain-containing protein, partial [Thiolapillus sp.]|uniref:DUF58 domain-containing protein n=1 Tax=Thiolapillus sp. TaxID=2017437 RepID=UPI003AF96377